MVAISGRLFLVAAVVACAAYADEPSASYIFPAGGQRGTTVDFKVGAHFLHGGSPFEMRGPGIDASSRIEETDTIWFEGPMIFKPASQRGEHYPKDHLGSVKIADDAPLGPRDWQLWTSQGVIPSRKFLVGNLPEIVEPEIDGRPIPVGVTLPVTINGRIFPREDVDVWTFDGDAGQSVVCEVNAARLGSPLDSRLEVREPSGHIVAENIDHFGTDSFLRFVTTESGTYQVRIHDSSFRGLQDYVYRLTITSGPYVECVYPLGGQAGSTVAFQVDGQQVPDEPIAVQMPSDRVGLRRLPVGESTNSILIDVSDLPEHLESEPNDKPATNHPAKLPAVFNGRVDRAGDVDLWVVTASKGQQFEFELAAARFGSPLDGVLAITDAGGKELKRIASTISKPIEPKFNFSFPADGTYFLSVADMLDSRGGPEFAYRLKVSPLPQPDFRLRLPTDAVTAFRGKEAKVKIAVERLVGFKGEIQIEIKGLPEGVAVSGTTIPANKKDTQISFKPSDDAKIHVDKIKIVGTAKSGERTLTRTATLGDLPGLPERENVLLAVAMPTPFVVDGVAFQTNYAARGTVHRRRFALHRNGYEGPLKIDLADRQVRHLQGVTAEPIKLPPDATEFEYGIRIPTWLEINRTGRVVVMAVGEVEDAGGTKHTVSYSSGVPKDQVIILTAPCPLSVRTDRTSIRAEDGQSLDLEIHVARGVLKPAPVKVELVQARHIRGVQAQPLTILADQTSGKLRLNFREPLGPFNTPLVVRATTMSEGDPVIAETKVEFVRR